MEIFIGKNGEQLGPFDVSDLANAVQSGRIRSTDLAWAAGEDNWVPLHEFAAKKCISLNASSSPGNFSFANVTVRSLPETISGVDQDIRKIYDALVCKRFKATGRIHGYSHQRTSASDVRGGGVVVNGSGGSSVRTKITTTDICSFWIKIDNGPDVFFEFVRSFEGTPTDVARIPVADGQQYVVNWLALENNPYSKEVHCLILLLDDRFNQGIALQHSYSNGDPFRIQVEDYFTNFDAAKQSFKNTVSGESGFKINEEEHYRIRPPVPLSLLQKILGVGVVAALAVGVFGHWHSSDLYVLAGVLAISFIFSIRNRNMSATRNTPEWRYGNSVRQDILAVIDAL